MRTLSYFTHVNFIFAILFINNCYATTSSDLAKEINNPDKLPVNPYIYASQYVDGQKCVQPIKHDNQAGMAKGHYKLLCPGDYPVPFAWEQNEANKVVTPTSSILLCCKIKGYFLPTTEVKPETPF